MVWSTLHTRNNIWNKQFPTRTLKYMRWPYWPYWPFLSCSKSHLEAETGIKCLSTLLMGGLSVCEALQWKRKTDAVFCACPMRCSLHVPSLTWPLWEHLGSWWGWQVDKVPGCQDFWHKRMQILGCLGTSVLTLWCCQNRDGEGFEDYKFIFSDKILPKLILHVQIVLWKWGFAISCRGESWTPDFMSSCIPFYIQFWWLLDRYKTNYFWK